MTKAKIDENLIFEIDPLKIIVKEDRPRQRKDLGEVAKLAESIKTVGQINPILIDRENGLVAGGRRLAACMLLGTKARVAYKDSIDPILLREIELEENVQRKDLTPAEESLAIQELVDLKRARLGTPTPGREGGFTLSDAADLVGKTKGSVIESLNIANMVKQFPALSECKTKSEIKSAVKGLLRKAEEVKALASYEEKIKTEESFKLHHANAEDFLQGIPDGTVNLFFSDPPYGIDVHDIAMTTGGQTGGKITNTATSYDDSENYAKSLLEVLAKESYRVTKSTGHAMVFCAPSHFQWLSNQMVSAGWLVAPRPVIWIKRESGQNNQPEKWFSAAYEFILFARKSESSLVLQGRPDWIQCDPVVPSQRLHQAEKPVDLCKELVARCCLPGQTMVDPCMGSAALVEAGFRMKLMVQGCEKDDASYATAVARMSKVKEASK